MSDMSADEEPMIGKYSSVSPDYDESNGGCDVGLMKTSNQVINLSDQSMDVQDVSLPDIISDSVEKISDEATQIILTNSLPGTPNCSTPKSINDIECDTSFIRKVDMKRLRRKLERNPQRRSHRSSYLASKDRLEDNDNTFFASSRDSLPLHKKRLLKPEQILYEYANPFSPDSKVAEKALTEKFLMKTNVNTVRTLTLSDSEDNSRELNESDKTPYVPERHRLYEFNVLRFNEEFINLSSLGSGVHGCVYKCINRINGIIYAIKKTKKPIVSSLEERIIRNEIYAHGILEHPNVVRNYSSWHEKGYVYIQNEYCNGGNLSSFIEKNTLSDSRLYTLLGQMGNALRYMHKKGLAHLDVKPANIFLSVDPNIFELFEEKYKLGQVDDSIEVIFKLGDLGHVVNLEEKSCIEEGDCRYLPRELLEDKFDHLDRADIFSLGLSIYEAAGAGPLPKNGEEWHKFRNGELKYLKKHTTVLQDILKLMIQPEVQKRPTAEELVQMIQPNCASPCEEISGCIQKFRRNAWALEHQVEATGQYLKFLVNSNKQLQQQLNSKDKTGNNSKDKLFGVSKKKGAVTKSRMVGKKTRRSSSTTTF